LIFVASARSVSSIVSKAVVRVRTKPAPDTLSDTALTATLSGRSAMIRTSSSPSA